MSKSVYFSEAFVLEIFRNGIFSKLTEIKNSLIVGTYRNKVDQILKFIKNTCYKICIISKNICPHV
jgi:hypothetical protein